MISKAFISDEEDSSGDERKLGGEGLEAELQPSSPTTRADNGSSASSQSESEERLEPPMPLPSPHSHTTPLGGSHEFVVLTCHCNKVLNFYM